MGNLKVIVDSMETQIYKQNVIWLKTTETPGTGAYRNTIF